MRLNENQPMPTYRDFDDMPVIIGEEERDATDRPFALRLTAESLNNWEAGEGIEGTVNSDWVEVRGRLIERARIILPKTYKFEIRKRYPTGYGRLTGVAWYANRQMQELPLEDRSEVLWLDSYGFWGRFEV